MSKGMHGGYSGTHGSNGLHRNFIDNLPELTQKYPLSPNGYFGAKGHGNARHIESDNPLKTAMDFYKKATKGAVTREPINDKKTDKPIPNAEAATMKDGIRIQIRKHSHSDGSPAVDICIEVPGVVKKQKIHFIKKGVKK